jgi:hypothetical protein
MDAEDRALELYRLEYQKAAERYDNIYRSMWTIFSYLTAVAAGILTFGVKTGIEYHELRAIALTPLLFWFWTTYLPLDRYGNEALNRLGKIEEMLNSRFGTNMDHFRLHFNSASGKELRVLRPLLSALRAKDRKAICGQLRRARFAICFIFTVLNAMFIYEVIAWLRCALV